MTRKPTPKPATKVAAKKAPAKKASKPAAKSVSTNAVDTPDAPALTPNQERFVHEYVATMNATRSYMTAYPEAKLLSARVQGCRLLVNPNVAAAIAAGREAAMTRNGAKLDELVERLVDIATADPREIMEWKVGCCRHCYGTNYLYQRTRGEMDRDREAHERAQLANQKKDAEWEFEPFDEKGGIGYDPRKLPVDECAECFGRGQGQAVFKDTRMLSPKAAALFAGVKITKDGIEIKTHDQEGAIDKLVRHLGGYAKDGLNLNVKVDAVEELKQFLASGSRLPIAAQGGTK